MADDPAGVYGGVDTPKDARVAAAVDPDGYRGLQGWLCSFGPLVRIGVSEDESAAV